MKITNRLWRFLLMPLALAGTLSMSSAAEVTPAALTPAALVFKLPDQIPWSPVDARGGQQAVVGGDPSKPGVYMVYTKWTNGNHFSRPPLHAPYHPTTHNTPLLEAPWWAGPDPNFDPEHATPMPAGSFVTHFGKQV